ncbi:MAG: hypothetical protein AAF546_12110 [Verrucomicrobiota bacterium]
MATAALVVSVASYQGSSEHSDKILELEQQNRLYAEKSLQLENERRAEEIAAKSCDLIAFMNIQDFEGEENLVLTIVNNGPGDAVNPMVMWGYVPKGLKNFDDAYDESNPPPESEEDVSFGGDDVAFNMLGPIPLIPKLSRQRFRLGSIHNQKPALLRRLQSFGKIKIRIWIAYSKFPGAENISYTNDDVRLADSLIAKVFGEAEKRPLQTE